MKIKLILGFRKDQEHSVDIEEAHKAYYLFLNPEKRGVFSNGLAIRGDQIQEIVPDYNGTMGWNPSHILDNDDWNELRSKGIASKMVTMLAEAKKLSMKLNPNEMNIKLSSFLTSIPERNSVKIIGEVIQEREA